MRSSWPAPRGANRPGRSVPPTSSASNPVPILRSTREALGDRPLIPAEGPQTAHSCSAPRGEEHGNEYDRDRTHRHPFDASLRDGEQRLPAHGQGDGLAGDRKSTRLNSSHVSISYAVFCLKKKRTDHVSWVQLI